MKGPSFNKAVAFCKANAEDGMLDVCAQALLTRLLDEAPVLQREWLA